MIVAHCADGTACTCPEPTSTPAVEPDEFTD